MLSVNLKVSVMIRMHVVQRNTELRYQFLGRYETEEQAAIAYNYAVVEFWDGNGYLNDIEWGCVEKHFLFSEMWVLKKLRWYILLKSRQE